jgi:hypothetical protein
MAANRAQSKRSGTHKENDFRQRSPPGATMITADMFKFSGVKSPNGDQRARRSTPFASRISAQPSGQRAANESRKRNRIRHSPVHSSDGRAGCPPGIAVRAISTLDDRHRPITVCRSACGDGVGSARPGEEAPSAVRLMGQFDEGSLTARPVLA